eukprot:comp22432_c0_seq2/m.33667 comp22432_c0_seq2/g.33667  ORF comp22432_c0_seq2/g.33667 comp22432_c0_seq2/m.33667 type:complete len:395 (-) comp22432_c0_seq2:296-1480(-)
MKDRPHPPMKDELHCSSPPPCYALKEEKLVATKDALERGETDPTLQLVDVAVKIKQVSSSKRIPVGQRQARQIQLNKNHEVSREAYKSENVVMALSSVVICALCGMLADEMLTMRGCCHKLFCPPCRKLVKDLDSPCCDEYKKAVPNSPKGLNEFLLHLRPYYKGDRTPESYSIPESDAMMLAKMIECACGNLFTGNCVKFCGKCKKTACDDCLTLHNGVVKCECGVRYFYRADFMITISDCLRRLPKVAAAYKKPEKQYMPGTLHEQLVHRLREIFGNGTHLNYSLPDENTIGKKPPAADVVNLDLKIVVEVKPWNEWRDAYTQSKQYRTRLMNMYGGIFSAFIVFFVGSKGPASPAMRADALYMAAQDHIVVYEHRETVHEGKTISEFICLD